MNPEAQHLYIMQNEHGAVKIGRSIHPHRRRRQIELEDRCRVEIVGVAECCGDLEETILLELIEAGLQVDGEWFVGTAAALPVYLAMFDLPEDTVWPFTYNEKTGACWMAQLSELRSRRFDSRMIGRVIEHLRASKQGDEGWDVMLWRNFGPDDDFRHRERPKGIWITSGPLAGSRLPAFTTDLDAALSLWPQEQRPASFTGTALECCIGALQALRKRSGKRAASRDR